MKKEKIVYFDYLRVFATIAVIVIHVASQKWSEFGVKSFEWNVLNFYDIESIILHVMLALTATSSFMKGDFKFTASNIYLIPIFMLILACWAEFGNTLFGTNFMYIRENGLPFTIIPGHHLFTYALIAVLIFSLMYLPFIIKYIKSKNKNSAQD